jgi:hypothetical protein
VGYPMPLNSMSTPGKSWSVGVFSAQPLSGPTTLELVGFDGSDKKGNNILANGIEQCAFNPRDKKFYLNIPATVAGTPPSPGPGLVLTISEHAPYHVERVFTIDPVATGCAGPAGLAVGPSNQMALGCGGTNSLIINSTNGKPAVIVTGEGGTDEAWYNPTANQYYFARSAAAVLGVENAGPPANAASTDNTPTALVSHSVAADPKINSHPRTPRAKSMCRSALVFCRQLRRSAPRRAATTRTAALPFLTLRDG